MREKDKKSEESLNNNIDYFERSMERKKLFTIQVIGVLIGMSLFLWGMIPLLLYIVQAKEISSKSFIGLLLFALGIILIFINLKQIIKHFKK